MDISDLIRNFLAFSLGLPRALGMFIMIPAFSRHVLPGSARNAVAISFAVFMYPVYSKGLNVTDFSALYFFALIIKESLIGVLMGFVVSIVFWSVQAMGFVIDNQRGATMASSMDPMTGAQTSPLGIFMMQVLTVFFFASGSIFFALRAFYNSYVALPVSSFYPDLDINNAVYFLGLMDNLMAMALLFAAPALIAMFLSEFALGLISRFAPQLNVFFLSMPVKSAVGMFLLVLCLVNLSDVWYGIFENLPGDVGYLQGILQ